MSKRITAVLGDYYHERDNLILSLEQAVAKLEAEFDLEIKIDFLSVDKLIEHLKTKPDAVILSAENRINPEDADVKTWMEDTDAITINNYVKEGGGWLAWHAGLASFENIKQYTTMLKGYFVHHPKEHQVVKYYTNNKASFLKENETIEFTDEHYFVQVESGNTNVFFESESIDGSSIAGWNHEYGKGKVVCLTPAHMQEGLMNQSFSKILAGSLGWLCDVVQ